MTTKAKREKLESARIELVKSLPGHLSLDEKKQLREFIDGVMNLRHDEVAAGFDLYQALVRCKYAPRPWQRYTDLLGLVRDVFDSRETAALFRNDPEGFRKWYDYVGSEYERKSSDSELKEAFEEYCRFGYAEKWDFNIPKFRSAYTEFWGTEHSLSYFESALEETISVLCFPIFKEELANPLLERWPLFSDKFQPFQYTPRRLESMHLQNVEPSAVFF